MTWLIAYALCWVAFSSAITLALSNDPHPSPRKQALAIMGLGAAWPVIVLIVVVLFFLD